MAAGILGSFTMIRNEGAHAEYSTVITIHPHVVSFCKATIRTLGSPEAVQLYLNREKKEAAIKPCLASDPWASRVKYFKNSSAVISNTSFIRTVCRMAGVEEGKFPVYFVGEYDPDEKALFFDLADPKFGLKLKGRGRKRR